MKITKKQREKAIKIAINGIEDKPKNRIGGGLCYWLEKSIGHVLNTLDINYTTISKYLPEFKYSTAKECFKAKENHGYWWPLDRQGDQHRVDFLNYLLTGKLPKKGKTK
jgi:hypothetical protein